MFLNDNTWTLDYTVFNPQKEKNSEALCTVGNGYLGTRAAFEELDASEFHYPGTYIAGTYNRLISKVENRDIENEDFVNCPNWTYIRFKIDDGDWIDFSKGEILEFHKQLNMKQGVLARKIRFRDDSGKITRIESLRFVSMKNAHIAGIRYNITAENYQGKITIQSALNGDLSNTGVDRYKDLNSLHLEAVEEGQTEDHIYLSVITNQSDITISQAAKHTLQQDGEELKIITTINQKKRFIAEEISVDLVETKALTLDKIVSVFTSRDQGISNPLASAQEEVSSCKEFDLLLKEHQLEWHSLWEKMDIIIEGDDKTQQIIRFHSYHLLITCSLHNVNIDASVPARGLHGEAYRGHIFWDELYILPVYTLHFPSITRSLLLYRFNRLDKARKYAQEHGYKGAMYPWQSGSDGREETQITHLNPISGTWGDDYSSLQRHVSLAIAYNIWMYYWMTEDKFFLTDYGAEMLFEISRFWASKATHNSETGKYDIDEVMGPDEYHEKYPNASKGGIKNNAYTNILVTWLLEKSLQCKDMLTPEEFDSLKKKLNLTDEEFTLWKNLTEKLTVVEQNEIIGQFEGFFDLEELDWETYRKKYGNIARLDRILKAEGLSPDDYQLSKQADFLMLFYLLPRDQVMHYLNKLGIAFSEESLKKNFAYYLDRTSHGSTLSLIVHAYIANLINEKDQSLEWFEKALGADIDDIQGGTVKEGIHAGLMAGTINVLLTAYVGLQIYGKKISLQPNLPQKWKRIKCNFSFKNVTYFLILTDQILTLYFESNITREVTVNIQNKEYVISLEQIIEIPYTTTTS